MHRHHPKHHVALRVEKVQSGFGNNKNPRHNNLSILSFYRVWCNCILSKPKLSLIAELLRHRQVALQLCRTQCEDIVLLERSFRLGMQVTPLACTISPPHSPHTRMIWSTPAPSSLNLCQHYTLQPCALNPRALTDQHSPLQTMRLRARFDVCQRPGLTVSGARQEPTTHPAMWWRFAYRCVRG